MATSVLVVEDDRNIAELLQLYLEKEGYAVTVAHDGGAGIEKYRAIGPDLVLLDLMMPVMDGWEVCKAIRAEDGCIKYDYYLSEKDETELLLIEQWETKQHQQIHIAQPHMAQLRGVKGDYITNTVLGEIELK